MILNTTALTKRLKERMDPKFLIHGKEPFLVERCCDVIREQARTNGYTQRISMTVNPDFSWDSLQMHMSSQSLFAEKKLIELRLPSSGRPGIKGAEALNNCLKSSTDDVIVVLIAGALESDIKRSKWFKSWQEATVCVDNPVMHSRQFQEWIKNMLNRKEIRHEPEVVSRLAYYFEGNMLAAANEIRKLVLGYDGSVLTVAEIERIVADQGRFNVFAMVDACLNGNSERAVRLLGALRNEGTEPVLVLWTLARETRIVYRVSFAVAKGSSPNQIFQQMRVWQSRQGLVSAASKRLGVSGSVNVMRAVAQADRILKGREDSASGGTIWNEFECIALMICGMKHVHKQRT